MAASTAGRSVGTFWMGATNWFVNFRIIMLVTVPLPKGKSPVSAM